MEPLRRRQHDRIRAGTIERLRALVLEARWSGHPAHRPLALGQRLERRSRFRSGVGHTLALLHVEDRVVAQDGRRGLLRLLLVFDLLLVVPLPEHDWAAALALL